MKDSKEKIIQIAFTFTSPSQMAVLTNKGRIFMQELENISGGEFRHKIWFEIPTESIEKI